MTCRPTRNATRSARISRLFWISTRAKSRKISRSQRILERISRFIGQPVFLGIILLFVAFWILANVVLRQSGMAEFDPGAVFMAARDCRSGRVADRTRGSVKTEPARQARGTAGTSGPESNLLTEQKTAKLIDLLEELRRDLPNVKNRHDPEAATLQQSMNPELVLAALDERGEPDKQEKPAGETTENSMDKKMDNA